MERCPSTTVAILVLAVALCPMVAGQQGPPFRGEAFVNTVEVPVRVVDRDGIPVPGLSIEDFEILEDGLVQRVTNFQEIGVVPPPSAETAEPSGQVRRYRFGSAATRDRDVVYFLDLMLSEKLDRDRAVDGLRELYGDGVPAGERVSIVTFDGGLEPLLERCTSAREVMDALDIAGRTRARGHLWGMHYVDPDDLVSGMPDQRSRRQAQRSISRSTRRQYFQELRATVDKIGAAVSATLARYADGDARKALVVFTPGLPRSNWSGLDGSWDAQAEEPSYIRRGLWYTTAMEAADLGFTLYFVDSSTARYAADTDVDKSPAIGSGLAGVTDASEGDDLGAEPDEDSGFSFENTRRDVLAQAAYLTGGEALHASDVDRALKKLSDDLGHYYSLAYQPEHAGDGREHRIAVRLPNHPGLRLEHRQSYVDRPWAERERQQLKAQMLFGTGSNLHAITVEFGEASRKFRFGARGMKRVTLPVEVRVPFFGFTLVPSGPEYAAFARFAFVVEDGAGNVSEVVNHEMVVTVPRDQVEAALERGHFTFVTELETEGGKQTLHVAVTDVVAERTSLITEEIKL